MFIDLSKNIYDKMQSHQFVMSLMGNINQDILKSILRVTEKKLNSLEVESSVQKRIFHFMVECVQSLCKIDQNALIADSNLFLIGKSHNKYIVYVGCMCNLSECIEMENVIVAVNSIELSEVKEKFYSHLSAGIPGKNNHVLTSLLDIYKRTKEKIKYEIIDVNDASRFLCFKATIS